MKYDSNARQVILNIKRKLLSSESQDALLLTIAQSVYASNQKRIHTNGKNTVNNLIGNYSVKPTYINPKASPKKFQPKGKTGKTNFADGRPHKTKYFVGGYRGFRESIGRSTNVVNLQLTGSLFANFQLVKSGTGYNIGFMSNKKAQVAKGLEHKYGGVDIWGVSIQDKKDIKNIINNWVKK